MIFDNSNKLVNKLNKLGDNSTSLHLIFLQLSCQFNEDKNVTKKTTQLHRGLRRLQMLFLLLL